MPKRILVTEDSPTILEIIKNTLEDAGFSVITAIDGMEALDKIRKEKPDLIILDLMLPKIDGFKICMMVKRDSNFKKIPIIILTARASDSDKKIGQEVSADAYITKPFEPQVLLSKIKEHLKNNLQP